MCTDNHKKTNTVLDAKKGIKRSQTIAGPCSPAGRGGAGEHTAIYGIPCYLKVCFMTLHFYERPNISICFC